MKVEFLHKDDNNTRLILVFAGWGADSRVAADIRQTGWDLAVVHDFSDFTLDTSFLDRYYTVYLFAWSLGVFAASRLLPSERITAAFAINGTAQPVNEQLGIPPEIFRGTYSRLDARNLRKFRLRMAGDKKTYAELSQLLTPENEADIENLASQLRRIEAEAMYTDGHEPASGSLQWTRAYIGRNDHIFSVENMRRAWAADPEVQIVESDSPHYMRISEVVRSVIADPEKVSERFAKAAVTYDTHAIAQYTAAVRLTAALAAQHPRRHGRVLEIGCGTGLFTREYMKVLQPAEVTFVDITRTGPFGLAPEERYVVADAEQWIRTQDCQWDAIVSASAIQWFADIPHFLEECSRRLTPGGVLAISTFLPGNMEELDAMRPSPLLYPKLEMLRECMAQYFSNYTVEEDKIRVEFRSVREMLMHLKHTGVAGSAPGSGATITQMSHLRSLTYRPVYLTGRI